MFHITRRGAHKVLSVLQRDYIANNKGKRAMLILTIYRMGNLCYYSELKAPLRRIVLAGLSSLNAVLVFYPLGIEIPFSCRIGAGLRMPHQNGIVLQGATEIGEDCTIYHQVTLGENERSAGRGGPIVGNRVYLGAGAKVIGRITIGDDSTVGANAVVVRSLEPHSTAICRQKTIAAKGSRPSSRTDDRNPPVSPVSQDD